MSGHGAVLPLPGLVAGGGQCLADFLARVDHLVGFVLVGCAVVIGGESGALEELGEVPPPLDRRG